MIPYMNGSTERVQLVHKEVGFLVNRVKTIKKEQNLVEERMLLRERNNDADPLVLLVRTIKEGEDKMIWKNVLKKNCGCGQDPCKKYGSIKKAKGERHFFEDGKQWTGETHKHPDGTLMSGKEHVEGESKKLYHLYELDEKVLRHLSKETTEIE